MKTFKTVLTAFVLAFAAIYIASCSLDDSSRQQALTQPQLTDGGEDDMQFHRCPEEGYSCSHYCIYTGVSSPWDILQVTITGEDFSYSCTYCTSGINATGLGTFLPNGYHYTISVTGKINGVNHCGSISNFHAGYDVLSIPVSSLGTCPSISCPD